MRREHEVRTVRPRAGATANERAALDDASIARLWTGIGARRRSLARKRKALSAGALGAVAALMWGRHPRQPRAARSR